MASCSSYEAMLDGAEVQRQLAAGRVPEGGDDSLAALKQQSGDADVVGRA